MPIDFPLGTYRNGVWAAYRLTTGKHYVVLPHSLDRKLQYASPHAYWRFMARQLRRIGVPATPATAWRRFAD
jgi:hypothetical protein